MSWTSASAAKSRCLRQTNGASSAISASPALASPAQGARLDHRGAFPGPPFPLVIMQRRLGRDRHLRRGRIGPQAQIDAEHIAVAGALLQQARQRLRHAHEERRRLDVGDQRGGGGIEKHDQVDVAGIVQFARAHLAHREHDQAAALLRPVGIGGGHAAARDLLAQQEAQAPPARRLPQDRSAPPSPASPARPRRCRTARSTARPPTSCGEADASRRPRRRRRARRARFSRSARRDAVPGRMPAGGSAARHRRGSGRTDRARTRRCRAGWPWRTDDPATRRSQPIAAGSSSASQSPRRCSALLLAVICGPLDEPRGQGGGIHATFCGTSGV